MHTILFIVSQPYRLSNCIMFENSDKFNYFYIIKNSTYNTTVKNMFLNKKKSNYFFYNNISSIIELINEKKINCIFFSCLNKYESVLLEIKKNEISDFEKELKLRKELDALENVISGYRKLLTSSKTDNNMKQYLNNNLLVLENKLKNLSLINKFDHNAHFDFKISLGSLNKFFFNKKINF